MIYRKKKKEKTTSEVLDGLIEDLDDQELIDHFRAINASLDRMDKMVEEMHEEEAINDALLEELDAAIRGL